MAAAQGPRAAAQQGPFQGMQQFPEIPRPRQRGQGPAQAGTQGRRLPAQLPAQPGHQGRQQKGELVPPLGQGRQGQHRPLEPEQQIAAEAAGFGQGLQAAVAGRGEAHIDALAAVTAQPAHLAILQDPQEHRLQARGQLGDLVQEQGTAPGRFDGALAVPQGAGEGAPDMAEQLRFQQGLGEGRAVHRHQGAAAAGKAVQFPGRHFLAAARGPLEQHRQPGRGDPGQFAQEPGHGVAAIREQLPRRGAGCGVGSGVAGGHPPTLP